MGTTNYMAATGNEAAYVSENQLADAAMFIGGAMRLIEQKDGEAYCLLDKAMTEIVAAQDYLEAMDPIESPICVEVYEVLRRIGRKC